MPRTATSPDLTRLTQQIQAEKRRLRERLTSRRASEQGGDDRTSLGQVFRAVYGEEYLAD